MLHHEASGNEPAAMSEGERLIAFSTALARERRSVPRLPHSHPDRFEVLLICAGEGSVRVAGRRYSVRPGDLVMVNAGAVHEESLAQADILAMFFRGVILPGRPENAPLPPGAKPVVPCGDVRVPLSALVNAIRRRFETSGGESAAVQALGRAALALILERASAAESAEADGGGLAERVRDYLDQHYRESLSLDALGAAFGRSPWHLARTFEEAEGFGPMRYVQRRRIGEAQELLICTAQCTEDIARAVGYQSANTFGRAFRRETDISAAQFRKLHARPQASASDNPARDAGNGPTFQRAAPKVSEGPTGRLVYSSRVEMSDLTDCRRILHRHEDWLEMVLVCGGMCTAFIDGQRYPVRRGDLLIYNSGVLHDETFFGAGDLTLLGMAIRDLSMPGLPKNHIIPAGLCPVVPCGEDFPALEALFAQLYERMPDPGQAQVCHRLSQTIVAVATDCVRTGGRSEAQDGRACGEIAREAILWMGQHASEPVTLNRLSAAVSVSPSCLSHAFKRAAGDSPMRYLARYRLGEAQERLIHTDQTVTDIAMEVGYNSVSSFNTAFKRWCGRAPGDFRRTFVQR